MLGFITLVLIFVTLLVFYLHKNAKKRPDNFPPGPPRLPIWGSYWFLLKENYNMLHLAMASLGKQYKTDLLGFYLGEAPTVVALSHELSRELLTRDEFVGRVNTPIVRLRSRGEPRGIFFTDGELWQGLRRFTLRHLRDYGFGRRSDFMENLISDEVQYLLNFLHNEPKKEDMDVCKGKGHVLVPDFLYGSLINTIMPLLCSTQFDNHRVRQYGKAAFRFMKSGDATGGAITVAPWLRYIAPDFFGWTSADKDNAYLLEFMKEVVDEHLKTFSDDHHRDLIDDYISENIRQGTELDYDQLLLVMLDYMFPSPIGIGHTLSYFFAFLMNNPDVQEKIQEEIDRVIGSARVSNLDDRKDLHYFEACFREILRILPIVPIVFPRRSTQDTTLGGYFIPKNTVMLANVWTSHRDERAWPNADKFQPERFLDENGHLTKKENTIGFGAGKRLCAGETYAKQAMFLIATAILQNFTIKSPTGKPDDLEDSVPGIILTLKQPWMLMVPRT